MYMTDASARIVLVEDHTILREGLRALIELESDLQVVGEASTGAEGVRVVRDTNPTLVITDLAMPGGSGLRTIDELRAACPNLRVLVLTAYCTDQYIGAAFSAGADGYVLKNASRAELLQAIRSVIAGQKSFSEPVSARLLSGCSRRNDPAADPLFAVRNDLLPRRDVDQSFIDEYRAAQSACRQRRQRGRLH
jgi:two-component system invasion response regulator UvrY